MTGRALVIGYGSIGIRHTRVLEELGYDVSVVSRRGEAGGRRIFASLEKANGPFDYAVIASETANHFVHLAGLAMQGHRGDVVIEKPLFAVPQSIPTHSFRHAGVGYNLRFHPAVQAMRAAIAGRSVQMVELSVGQWLGDWRPGRETKDTYSATRADGGGVLRDLSHELDLAIYLFGPWKDVTARGGRFGDVTKDADDGWGILLSCERCPLVVITLNYFDRVGRRAITVQAEGQTFHADLVANVLDINGRREQTFALKRDETYAAMHRAFHDGSPEICSLDQGLVICGLVEAIETAQRDRRWIDRVA